MPRFRLRLLVSVGLVVLTLAAYGQLWDNDFIDVDDQPYIEANPLVRAGLTSSGLRWAWTTDMSGNWIPLTWMSLQLDASLSNLLQDPAGNRGPLAPLFHAQNLLWHTATVVLLFVVLCRLTGGLWRSALVAALFAVHPLHVESVAWVSERKDVLSTFFWVLTLLAYCRYTEQPSVGRYLLIIAALVLGLLAKPMLVTLPCVLLLLDWWPLQRWPAGVAAGGPLRLLVEKVPLFAIAAAACVVAVVAQGESISSVDLVSFSARLANAVVSYGWYLEKTFWPTGLAFFYPHPVDSWQWGPVLISGAVLLAVTVVAAAGARTQPWLLVGWLWFLGTLVPVIGLVQIGSQARADRYAYVPHIGLFIALVWSAAALLDRLRLPVAVRASLAAVCLLLLSATTWAQASHWRNPATLWEHALKATTDNHYAHYALARHFVEQAAQTGDAALRERAHRHAKLAVNLQPRNPLYRLCLGVVLREEENLDEAAEQFLAGIGKDPQPSSHLLTALGTVRWRQKKYDAARLSFLGALKRNPREPEALNGLGLVLLRQCQIPSAAGRFLEAMEANPYLVAAWSNRGLALACLGQWDDARLCQSAAVQLEQLRLETRPNAPRSDLATYHRRLGCVLHALDQKEAAAAEYAAATRLEPDWPQANGVQAWRLATAAAASERDPVTAWELASEVCQVSREPSAEALDTLAAALAGLGRFEQAAKMAERALARATPDRRRAITARIQRYQKGEGFVE